MSAGHLQLGFGYREWMEGTKLGVAHRRSPQLKQLDKAIQNYDRRMTEFYRTAPSQIHFSMAAGDFSSINYTETALITEVKAAFDQWVNSKGGPQKAQQSQRNKKPKLMISRLNWQLSTLVTHRSVGAAEQARMAADCRRQILWTLGHIDIDQPKRPQSWTQLMVKPVVTGKSIDTAADKVFSSQQIKEAVTTASSPHKELQWLCDFCNWLTKKLYQLAELYAELGVAAVAYIKNNLPDLAAEFLGPVVKAIHASPVAAGTFLTNLKDSYDFRSLAKKADNLADTGINSGHPRLVIRSLAYQIEQESLIAAGKAGLDLAKMGLTVAGGAGAAILSAVQSLLNLVYSLFRCYVRNERIREVAASARLQYRAFLFNHPKEFQRWFADSIDHIPLLSAYLITMPSTGSYYGYLSASCTTDDSLFTSEQLARNFRVFGDIKKQCQEFIKQSNLKLIGLDEVTSLALKTATGKSVNVTGLEGDFKMTKKLWAKKRVQTLLAGF